MWVCSVPSLPVCLPVHGIHCMSTSDSEIFTPDYYTIQRDRNRHGGGILFYIKESISSASIQRHPALELLFIEVTLRQGPLSIGLHYCPSPLPFPICSLSLGLSSFLNLSTLVKLAVLLGDFNVNLLSQSSLAQDVLSTNARLPSSPDGDRAYQNLLFLLLRNRSCLCL